MLLTEAPIWSLQVGAPAALGRLRCRMPILWWALSPTSDSPRPDLEAFLLALDRTYTLRSCHDR